MSIEDGNPEVNSDSAAAAETVGAAATFGPESQPSSGDWTAMTASDPISAIPGVSDSEKELLASLDTLVAQASHGAGDISTSMVQVNASPEGSNSTASVDDVSVLSEPSHSPETGREAEDKVESGACTDPSLVGTPEEWTALSAIGALDGDAVTALAAWLKTANPEEREVYSRRMRLGHALLYALEQERPPPDLRANLAQALGQSEPALRKLYPPKRITLSQQWAQSLGLPLARFLKSATVLVGALALAGWFWGGRQYMRADSLSKDLESNRAREASVEIALRIAQERLAFAASPDLRLTHLLPSGSLNTTNKSIASYAAETELKGSGETHHEQHQDRNLAPQAMGDQGKNAVAHLLWSPFGRRGLLWVRDLPAPPEGREYCLWVLSGSRQFSAARFESGADGNGLFIDAPSLQEG